MMCNHSIIMDVEMTRDEQRARIAQGVVDSGIFTPEVPEIDRLRAEVRRLQTELEEAQRAKYGTPCKCEAWIEACGEAEARAERAEAGFRAFLEGAEYQRIEELLSRGQTGDFRRLGEETAKRTKELKAVMEAAIEIIRAEDHGSRQEQYDANRTLRRLLEEM